jgi:hypothetical protein
MGSTVVSDGCQRDTADPRPVMWAAVVMFATFCREHPFVDVRTREHTYAREAEADYIHWATAPGLRGRPWRGRAGWSRHHRAGVSAS